jgi:hypothetical protein
LTLPGETLQFVNSAAEPARVLFICAPPYSPDDADTRLLEDHQSLTTQEIADAVERLLELRADLNTELDARIAVLTRLLETVSP